MDAIEGVLQMRHECGRSQREFAHACGLFGRGSEPIAAARDGGGSGVAIAAGPGRGRVARAALRPSGGCRDARREALDFAAMHKQLSRRKSLTLLQPWREYRETQLDGYGYSRYCELYREWKVRRSPVMLQEHRAGEKLFVDYGGQTVPVQDATSGAERGASVRSGAGGELGAGRGELDWIAGARLGILRGLPGGSGPGSPSRPWLSRPLEAVFFEAGARLQHLRALG